MHGGTVSAASKGVGRGSTFTVEFPVPPEGAVAPPPPEESAPGTPLRGVRVLFVDDEPDTRSAVSRLLRDAGAAVVEAGPPPTA